MSIADHWLLPDGVEDVLPPSAKRLEYIRRSLLDLYETWGYRYVIPPMVEYLESLLTGTGRDLDLKTFKVVDLLTGRTMGVRADITPQVARIDAHSLNENGVVRLCYAGTVVQSQPDSMLASRTPMSVGAELFGETTGRADLEIVSLMVESLRSLGLDQIHIELGDVGIFRQLMGELLIGELSLAEAEQEILFELVQKKAVAELRTSAGSFGLSDADVQLLCHLPGLCGDPSVLAKGRSLFHRYPGVVACISNLEFVSAALLGRFPDLNVYLDLSELRGYAYHTGMVFAAHVDGPGEVVAKGGRYDHIGEVFGRESRGATGFSINIRSLLHRAVVTVPGKQRVCLGVIPDKMAQALWQEVQRLRTAGYTVVETAVTTDQFDYRLEYTKGQWCLTPMEHYG